MSKLTSSSFWVTIFFLSIFAFVLIFFNLSCFVFIMISIITIITYVVVKHFMSYVDCYAETVVISTFDDCDILDKAIH